MDTYCQPLHIVFQNAYCLADMTHWYIQNGLETLRSADICKALSCNLKNNNATYMCPACVFNANACTGGIMLITIDVATKVKNQNLQLNLQL